MGGGFLATTLSVLQDAEYVVSGQFKSRVLFDRPFFTAGSPIQGWLDVVVSDPTDGFFREVSANINGVVGSSRSFLSVGVELLKVPLNSPPSRVTRKSRYVFPFSLLLPVDAPSSFKAKDIGISYFFSGQVGFVDSGRNDSIAVSREVFIFERASPEDFNMYLGFNGNPIPEPIVGSGTKKAFLGGKGRLELTARITKPIHCAGGCVYIWCAVKNRTRRKVSGVKVALTRKIGALITNADGITQKKDWTKLIAETTLRGGAYEFSANEEREIMVDFLIPTNIKTIRKIPYLSVSYSVNVTLSVSLSSLTVDIPITILNQASLEPPQPLSSIGISEFATSSGNEPNVAYPPVPIALGDDDYVIVSTLQRQSNSRSHSGAPSTASEDDVPPTYTAVDCDDSEQNTGSELSNANVPQRFPARTSVSVSGANDLSQIHDSRPNVLGQNDSALFALPFSNAMLARSPSVGSASVLTNKVTSTDNLETPFTLQVDTPIHEGINRNARSSLTNTNDTAGPSGSFQSQQATNTEGAPIPPPRKSVPQ